MGSQLCPGTAKQIIQQLQQIEKGQKSYDLFFKDCLQMKETKLQELLAHQVDDYIPSQSSHPQESNILQLENQSKNLDKNQSINLRKSSHLEIPINVSQTINLIFQDGTVYKGEVKDGLPHGEGQQITPFGESYRGSFKQGIKEGFGQYQFANKERYQGQFIQNMMWGKGIYYFANGDRYEGQFVKNEKSGAGIYTFNNQNKYNLKKFQGSYRNDLKQGNGILQYNNRKLQGYWRSGLYELIIDNSFIK